MDRVTFSFLLTFLAGFSTMIGIFPILVNLKREKLIISCSLAFASGVMLTVSIMDLIPESFLMFRGCYSDIITILLVFLSIMIGIIGGCLVKGKVDKVSSANNLYRVGIISMMAIILHNIPEGIVTFITTTKNTSLGVNLAISIAMHNIPEGISISIPIYYSTRSKYKAFFYTLVSALSEPLGAVITYLFLLSFINNIILGILFSFIAGLMIEISILELIPTSLEYSKSNISKVFFGVGIVVMLLQFII